MNNDQPLILICDDDAAIRHQLSLYMEEAGYATCEATDGLDLLRKIEQHPDIRLVLLDIMMPGLDGLGALTKLRETHNLPVLLLTAKSEERDLISGLASGADDYITKPFNPREVKARVAAQLRRYLLLGDREKAPAEEYRTGELVLDELRQECRLCGQVIALTPMEYKILRVLFQAKGEILSPKAIYERAWGQPCVGGENAVTVHIRHLREKLEANPSRPLYILVHWGRGYQLADL